MCLSHQPETLVTTAFSVLLTLLSILMDVPVKVGVGIFYHILATILNLSSLMLEMRLYKLFQNDTCRTTSNYTHV